MKKKRKSAAQKSKAAPVKPAAQPRVADGTIDAPSQAQEIATPAPAAEAAVIEPEEKQQEPTAAPSKQQDPASEPLPVGKSVDYMQASAAYFYQPDASPNAPVDYFSASATLATESASPSGTPARIGEPESTEVDRKDDGSYYASFADLSPSGATATNEGADQTSADQVVADFLSTAHAAYDAPPEAPTAEPPAPDSAKAEKPPTPEAQPESASSESGQSKDSPVATIKPRRKDRSNDAKASASDIHAFDGRTGLPPQDGSSTEAEEIQPSNWHHPSEETPKPKSITIEKSEPVPVDSGSDDSWLPVAAKEPAPPKEEKYKGERIQAILQTPVEGFRALPKYGTGEPDAEEERIGAIAHPLSEVTPVRADPSDRAKSIQRLKTRTTARTHVEAYTIIFCTCLVLGFITERLAPAESLATISQVGNETDHRMQEMLPLKVFDDMNTGFDIYEHLSGANKFDTAAIREAIQHPPTKGEARRRSWYTEFPGIILAPPAAFCYAIYRIIQGAGVEHTDVAFALTIALELSLLLLALIISLRLGIIARSKTWLNMLAPIYIFFIGILLSLPVQAIVSFATTLLAGPMGQTIKLSTFVAILVCLLDTAYHAFVAPSQAEVDPHHQ